MPRFDNGFVLLHRKCIANDIGEDPVVTCVWIKLLTWANVKDSTAMANRTQFKVHRGELLTSAREIADSYWRNKKIRFSQGHVRTALAYLEKTKRIVTRKGAHGTFIKICNYEAYQDPEIFNGKPIVTRSTNDPNTIDNRSQTDRQHSEINKSKNHNTFSEGTKVPPESRITPDSNFSLSLQGENKQPKVDTHTGARKRGGKPKTPTAGAEVWGAYASAYAIRYGKDPIRNAQTNGICTQLVKRLGADRAKQVVEFYVGHNERFYVAKLHMLKFCLADAEKLATECEVGGRMTASLAHDIDRQDRTSQAITNYLKAKHGEGYEQRVGS